MFATLLIVATDARSRDPYGVSVRSRDWNSWLQADPAWAAFCGSSTATTTGRRTTTPSSRRWTARAASVFDGDTLYVMHPPNLTAYRETTATASPTNRRTLVSGLGFDLDFRGADHTTNGVGSASTAGSTSPSATTASSRPSARRPRAQHARRRRRPRAPDGTGFEIYSRGQRNIYDVAVIRTSTSSPATTPTTAAAGTSASPTSRRRAHGYPSLFHNFPDEIVPPLADYGGGSGSGMLFVQEPGLPAAFGDALYSVDWGRTSSTATRCSRAARRSRLARTSSSACHVPPTSSSMAPRGCLRRAGRVGSIATLVSRSVTSPG